MHIISLHNVFHVIFCCWEFENSGLCKYPVSSLCHVLRNLGVSVWDYFPIHSAKPIQRRALFCPNPFTHLPWWNLSRALGLTVRSSILLTWVKALWDVVLLCETSAHQIWVRGRWAVKPDVFIRLCSIRSSSHNTGAACEGCTVPEQMANPGCYQCIFI